MEGITPSATLPNPELVKSARETALGSAIACGIVVEDVADLDAIEDVRSLVCTIWGPEIVPPRNFLKAITLAGSSVLLARRNNETVGFGIGIVGWDNGLHFHSHQIGIVAPERGSGIGFALKLAQRARCLAHGITEMRWTFDPLLSSNAHFNLDRLGAAIIDFHPNCYGSRTDAFNTDDVTDRIRVSWKLDQPVGLITPTSIPKGPALIETTPDVRRSIESPIAGAYISIPKDYQRLRTDDRATADAWRVAVGEAMRDVFATGLGLCGFGEFGYGVSSQTLKSDSR